MSGSATALSSYLYPTALSWGYPHLEVLAIGPSNHSVYWKYRPENATSTKAWDPQDSSLALVGGQLAVFNKGVAAVARSPGSVDIFVVGIPSTSYALFHKAHNASMVWDPAGHDAWDGLGGIAASGPTVVSWAQSRMDVFAIGEGPNYTLFQLTWQEADGWSDWNSLGGTWSTFTPTAVSWGEGRIDVFTVNPVTKALYHTYWDGSTWQPPNSFDVLDGYCTSPPVAVSWGAGRIDLFVRGGDAGLWHMSYSANAWSKWTSISGNSTIQGEPDAVSWGANRIDVFAWGSDGSLLHKSYDGTAGAWSPSDGFESIGQGLTGPPKSVSDAAGSVHVFAYTQGPELVHKAWNQTVGAWSPASDFEALGTP
jgi:hypothetical protein